MKPFYVTFGGLRYLVVHAKIVSDMQTKFLAINNKNKFLQLNAGLCMFESFVDQSKGEDKQKS